MSQLLVYQRVRLCANLLWFDLVIQDSMYLNFGAGQKGDDLGPIGDSRSKAKGLILHHSLAVSVEGLPLGMVTQKIWARGQYQPQTEDQRWAKPIEEKPR